MGDTGLEPVPPVFLSPLVEPSADIARQMLDGDLEGLVLKDRTSP